MTMTGRKEGRKKVKKTRIDEASLKKVAEKKPEVVKPEEKEPDPPTTATPPLQEVPTPILLKRNRPMSADVRPKPRPRSLDRPRSAGVTPWKSHEAERQALITNFNRSLRLLGLEVKEIKASVPTKPVVAEGPSFSTRLSRRTVSLDSVKASVMDTESVQDRRALASAVYQEWYFSKMAEERRKRAQEQEKQDKEQFDRILRKEELLRQSSENFARWKERKDKEMQAAKKKQEERCAEMERLRADSAKIQEALAQWHKSKGEALRQKERERKEKESEEEERRCKEQLEKQEHASKAYEVWKKRSDATLQSLNSQLQERERKLQQEKEKAQERRKDAQKSFAAWKQLKDDEIRSRIRQIRQTNQNVASERGRRLAERLYEAEQAYQEWLDSVMERPRHGQPANRTPRSPLSRHSMCT